MHPRHALVQTFWRNPPLPPLPGPGLPHRGSKTRGRLWAADVEIQFTDLPCYCGLAVDGPLQSYLKRHTGPPTRRRCPSTKCPHPCVIRKSLCVPNVRASGRGLQMFCQGRPYGCALSLLGQGVWTAPRWGITAGGRWVTVSSLFVGVTEGFFLLRGEVVLRGVCVGVGKRAIGNFADHPKCSGVRGPKTSGPGPPIYQLVK